MTLWKPKGRRTYRYRIYLFKQRYEGNTGCSGPAGAKAFQDALERELRLEAAGMVPHRLLKTPPDTLAIAADGSTRVDQDRDGSTLRCAEALRGKLVDLLNTPRALNGLTGFVYFIGAGGLHPIKIGYATNPRARLHGIQTSNPLKLAILAAVPGSKYVEDAVHGMLAEFRIGEGEWFRSGAELRAFIRLLEARPIVARRPWRKNLQSPEAPTDSGPETIPVSD